MTDRHVALTTQHPVLVLLGRVGCHLCERAGALVRPVAVELGYHVVRCDVDSDPQLRAAYGDAIPVVLRDGEPVLRWPFTKAEVRTALMQRGEP